MRAVVCGGGPVAVTLATYLASNKGVHVSIFTRRPKAWTRKLRVAYRWVASMEAQVAEVSADPSEVIPGARLIVLTVPAFARVEVLRRIQPYVAPDAWVGSFPGVGGFDWVARNILGQTQPVFGLQHVPWLTLTLRYGRAAVVTGVRPEVWVGTLPRGKAARLAALLTKLLRLPVRPLDNILVNALTPANPIFHTVRVYSLFRDWKPGMTFPEALPFYSAWDEQSSQYYLACDREIQAACRVIPLDLHQVWPILQHYRLNRSQELTERIRSLPALKLVDAPLVETVSGWVPNLESRFFTEDFFYGLLVVRQVARLAGVPTPFMDTMLAWAEELLGARLADDGDSAVDDRRKLPTPQSYGLNTLNDLVRHATAEH